MKGAIALVAGIIAVIFGTISFTVGCGLFLIICLLLTAASWITTLALSGRAQTNKRAADIGFYLGSLGLLEMVTATALCWIF